MFSLIITIISIALVAALALATLYYGGDAFNKSSAEAETSAVLTHIQQLQGAISLYQTTTSGLPTLAQLNSQDYLRSIPQVRQAQWADMVAGGGVYWLKDAVSKETCTLINKKMVQTATIPETPYAGVMASCFGPASGSTFNVIYSGASADVQSVLTTAQAAGQDERSQPIGVSQLLPLTALSTTSPGPTSGAISLKAMSNADFQAAFPYEIHQVQSLTAVISVPVSELGKQVDIPMTLTSKPAMYSIDGLWEPDYYMVPESIVMGQWTRGLADMNGFTSVSGSADLQRIAGDQFTLTVNSSAADAAIAKNGVVNYYFVFGRADDYVSNMWTYGQVDLEGNGYRSPSCDLTRIELTSSVGSIRQQSCP